MFPRLCDVINKRINDAKLAVFNHYFTVAVIISACPKGVDKAQKLTALDDGATTVNVVAG